MANRIRCNRVHCFHPAFTVKWELKRSPHIASGNRQTLRRDFCPAKPSSLPKTPFNIRVNIRNNYTSKDQTITSITGYTEAVCGFGLSWKKPTDSTLSLIIQGDVQYRIKQLILNLEKKNISNSPNYQWRQKCTSEKKVTIECDLEIGHWRWECCLYATLFRLTFTSAYNKDAT